MTDHLGAPATSTLDGESDDTVLLPPHASAAEAAAYAAQVHEELAGTAADMVELNAAALLAKHFHQHRPSVDWFRGVPGFNGEPAEILVARDLTPAERVSRPVGETAPPFEVNGLIELGSATAVDAERRDLMRVCRSMIARGEATHAAHTYGLVIGPIQQHSWVQVALALGHWGTFTGPK